MNHRPLSQSLKFGKDLFSDIDVNSTHMLAYFSPARFIDVQAMQNPMNESSPGDFAKTKEILNLIVFLESIE